MEMEKSKISKVWKYRLLEYGCRAIGVLVTFIPLLILALVKHNVYFTTKNTWSFTFSGIALMLIACLQAKKVTEKWGLPIWLGILLVLSILLGDLINDIQLILTVALVGSLVAIPFNKMGEHYEEIKKAYMSANIYREVNQDKHEELLKAIKESGRA